MQRLRDKSLALADLFSNWWSRCERSGLTPGDPTRACPARQHTSASSMPRATPSSGSDRPGDRATTASRASCAGFTPLYTRFLSRVWDAVAGVLLEILQSEAWKEAAPPGPAQGDLSPLARAAPVFKGGPRPPPPRAQEPATGTRHRRSLGNS